MKGFLALLLKETAVVAPHWLAAFLLVSVSAVLQMLSAELTLDGLSERMDGGEEALFLVFLIGFSIGHTLVAPDFAEGPIEFLDALPTSRLGLFLAKLVAGLLPAVGCVAMSLATDVILASLSPTPFGGSVIGPLMFGHGVLLTGAFAGFGLGMALSWLRGLAWAIVVLFVVVGGVAAILFPPIADYMPLTGRWGSIEFVYGQPTHPVEPLVFWTLVGAFGIASSGLLFLGPGAFLVRRGSWATGFAHIGTIGCSSLLVGLLAMLSLLGLGLRAPELFLDSVQSVSTEHFRLLFREDDRDHVEAMAAEIEALSASVGALVGNADPLWLDIEFLGAQQNHGGVFTGGKIRLQRGAERDVVAHELAHAHAFAIEGAAAWDQHDHMRFFSEGLASWAAARAVGGPEIPPLAAAIHANDPIAFDLLVEDRRFVEERDIAEAYPLGEAFVEALDAHGGVDVRRCVLEQTGRLGNEDIAGLALWNLLGQRCDFELDEVVRRFEALLEGAARDLPPLPTLAAEVRGTDLRVRIAEGSGAWRVVCRFRDDTSADVSHYVHVWTDEDGVCAIPAYRMSGTTFDYQVGFELADATVYRRWVTAPLP